METLEKKQSFWDLVSKYGELIESTGGEITPEVQALEIEVMRKVDACKYVIDAMSHAADQCNERITRLRARQIAFQSAADRLTKNIMGYMMQREHSTLDGEEYRAKLVRNPKKLVIDATKEVPSEFTTVKSETVVDNKRIREILDQGLSLPFAHYSHSYRIKWDERIDE